MADINLLPEEFRSKDNKERIDAKNKPSKTEVHLTKPEKSKDITTKKGFWNKIFPGGGGVQPLKSSKKNEIKIEPAKKKIQHLKSVSIGKIHVPDESLKKEVQPKTLTVSNDEVEKTPERKPPINPHMSDFQKPPKSLHDVEKLKKEENPMVHIPANGEVKKTEVTSKKMTDGGAPQITFDKPEGESKKVGVFGKVSDALKNIFYKITRKKNQSKIAVNLMPERRISFKDINWSRIVRMLFISIGGTAGITVIWYLVLLDQERKGQVTLSDLRNEVSMLQIEISQLREDQKGALLLKNKLDVAGDLLDEHIYWTNFLALFESLTLDGVYYNGLDATLNTTDMTTVSLSGTADTLETVFWQRETFRESEIIAGVTVEDASSNVGDDGEMSASFNIEIMVHPDAWKE